MAALYRKILSAVFGTRYIHVGYIVGVDYISRLRVNCTSKSKPPANVGLLACIETALLPLSGLHDWTVVYAQTRLIRFLVELLCICCTTDCTTNPGPLKIEQMEFEQYKSRIRCLHSTAASRNMILRQSSCLFVCKFPTVTRNSEVIWEEPRRHHSRREWARLLRALLAVQCPL